MKSGKHILLLTPGFAANEADDSCIPAMQVYLKTFRKLYPDYKLSLIAFHYPFSNGFYEWNGIEVFPCNGRNKKWLTRLKTIKTAKSFFESIHKNQKVDLIHSFWLGECAQVGEELSRKNNIPHLNTLMGQDVRASNRFLRRHFLSAVPEVALCNFHASEFEINAGRKPAAIIPWGIEEEKVELNNERNIDILAAGSLIELKRYDLLMKAVAELKKDFSSLRVTIAGDGPLKNDLEKLADSLGVRDNIHFAGQISREEVLELMKRSKVFFHPSSFESFGFVFVEAQKYGMAIVSRSVGIAENSENWKVAGSRGEMTVATKYFLLNKKEFKNEIIYSSKTTAKNYEALYQKMIAAV
jgi:1,2-diacylglycerol 3-alpha-glucosyltransferase